MNTSHKTNNTVIYNIAENTNLNPSNRIVNSNINHHSAFIGSTQTPIRTTTNNTNSSLNQNKIFKIDSSIIKFLKKRPISQKT